MVVSIDLRIGSSLRAGGAVREAVVMGWSVSGVVVRVQPERLDEVAQALAALPGIDVHRCDRAAARILVTQEAESPAEQAAGMERLRAVPGVVAAGLVIHRFGDDPAGPPGQGESEGRSAGAAAAAERE